MDAVDKEPLSREMQRYPKFPRRTKPVSAEGTPELVVFAQALFAPLKRNPYSLDDRLLFRECLSPKMSQQMFPRSV